MATQFMSYLSLILWEEMSPESQPSNQRLQAASPARLELWVEDAARPGNVPPPPHTVSMRAPRSQDGCEIRVLCRWTCCPCEDATALPAWPGTITVLLQVARDSHGPPRDGSDSEADGPAWLVTRTSESGAAAERWALEPTYAGEALSPAPACRAPAGHSGLPGQLLTAALLPEGPGEKLEPILLECGTASLRPPEVPQLCPPGPHQVTAATRS